MNLALDEIFEELFSGTDLDPKDFPIGTEIRFNGFLLKKQTHHTWSIQETSKENTSEVAQDGES